MSSKITISTDHFNPGPLNPILPWCKGRLIGQTEKEILSFLQGLDLYPEHISLFNSYFCNEIPQRQERVLPQELSYERTMLTESVWKILQALTADEKDSILITAKGEISPNQSSFLASLEKIIINSNLPINLENRTIEINWDEVSPIPFSQLPQRLLFHEELLNWAISYSTFTDYISACQIFGQLFQLAREGQLNLNIQQRALLFYSYGRSALSLELYDIALSAFNSLMNLGKAWENSEYLADAYRLTGEVYRKKGYIKIACRFFRKSLEEADKLDTIRYRFRGLFAFIQLEDKSLISFDEENDLLELTKKLNFTKSEALILMNLTTPDFDRAIEIFNQQKNIRLLSEAYYRRGMHDLNLLGTMVTGNSRVEKDLNKALKLGKKINTNNLMTQAQYGLALLYQKKGEQHNSFYNYSKAMEGFIKKEAFAEMSHAYFNLAVMALTLYQVPQGISFLNSALLIQKKLFPDSELSYKCQSLLILCHIAQGHKRKAESCLINLEARENKGQDNLKKIIEFCLFQNKNDVTQILSRINEWGFSGTLRGINIFLLIHCIQERKDDDEKGKKKLLVRIIREAEEMNLLDLLPSFHGAIEGEPLRVPYFKWMKEPIDRELVDSSLKQKIRFEQLKNKMFELNLLSEIQMIFGQRLERDILFLQTMERFLTSFLVSWISYYEKLEDSYRLAYYSSPFDEEPERGPLNTYLECIEKSKDKPVIISNTLRGGKKNILYIPINVDNKLDGIIICQLEHNILEIEKNDIQVFTILAGQIGAALKQINQRELIISKNQQLEKINKELNKTTRTDHLTGIGNRMQLNEKIEELSRKYTGARESDNFTLMFMDLDNFKYYNDNFGHAFGDNLLEEFTILIKNACRDSDWVFRYGGDEFIILLEGVCAENSTVISSRILDELQNKKGFQKELSLLSEKDVYIPPENWLGCSIGISDFTRADKKGEALLMQADKALYKAKELGKKRWRIYNKNGEQNG